jgi:hypothetical protein
MSRLVVAKQKAHRQTSLGSTEDQMLKIKPEKHDVVSS